MISHSHLSHFCVYLFVSRRFLANFFTHFPPLLEAPFETFPDVCLQPLNLDQVALVLLNLLVALGHLVEECLDVCPEQLVIHVGLDAGR